MTKSQLIQLVAEQHNLTRQEAETVVSAVFGNITQALEHGDRVELRGFGAFSVRLRPAREGRNPKTGELVSIPEKRTPFFKAGKEMRRRVDS
ncbi:MAG: integration host factor subunit beta [Magnetococcales bacterium]|nr:integration host factor subunit beta [Magnetococcales bacterium]